MAITETNASGNQSTGPEVQQQVEQNNAPRGAAMGERKWSFHNAGMFAAPIGRGLGSEYLNKLMLALSEAYKQTAAGVIVTLIPMDNVNEPALAFSTIIVAVQFKDAPESGVSYHLLIVEATGEKIPAIFEQVNGTQVETLRLTCDAMDAVLLQKAGARVRAAFPSGPCQMVDGCVIPRSFNPDDKYKVHQLALNAGLAAATDLELHRPNFEDINLASSQQDSNLICNIGFARQQIEDAVGDPMRSDVLVNFTSQRSQPQGRATSINSGDRESKISEISGFIDLIWAPVQQQVAHNPWVQQAPMQSQKYAARLIVTNLTSNFSYTPASVLLSLVTSLSIRDDSNWIQAFRPIAAGGDIDLHDIGALNIEANLSNEPNGFGTRIDTKSDSFKLAELGQLVSALIQPGLVISLDVPVCGPQTWYLSPFSAAASGMQPAIDQIIKGANDLTNNLFGRYFTPGMPMFADIGNRVHLGTWTDRNGQRRDIRDIDYLAVANFVGDRDPQAIREWSDTFTRVQYPLGMRMSARKKMIYALTNETAEFTGFADRITFSAQFLDALSRGCKEAGLAVRINTPLSGSDFNQSRGVGSFVGSAILQPGQQTFMSRDMGYGQQNFQGFNSGYNRWTS